MIFKMFKESKLDWAQALVDLAVGTAANVISAVVMIKTATWLDKKGAIKYFTVGKSRIGDESVIKGGWLSSAIIALAKWIQSESD